MGNREPYMDKNTASMVDKITYKEWNETNFFHCMTQAVLNQLSLLKVGVNSQFWGLNSEMKTQNKQMSSGYAVKYNNTQQYIMYLISTVS